MKVPGREARREVRDTSLGFEAVPAAKLSPFVLALLVPRRSFIVSRSPPDSPRTSAHSDIINVIENHHD